MVKLHKDNSVCVLEPSQPKCKTSSIKIRHKSVSISRRRRFRCGFLCRDFLEIVITLRLFGNDQTIGNTLLMEFLRPLWLQRDKRRCASRLFNLLLCRNRKLSRLDLECLLNQTFAQYLPPSTISLRYKRVRCVTLSGSLRSLPVALMM